MTTFISRKDLLTAVIHQQVSTVEIKEVVLIPGQPTTKHLHPCPVVGYILSGEALFQIEGQASKILKAGDPFYEPRDTTILHFDNTSTQKPLRFVAFYLKQDDEELIRLLNEAEVSK